MAPSVRAFLRNLRVPIPWRLRSKLVARNNMRKVTRVAAVLRQPRSAGLLRGREGGSRRELGQLALTSPECCYSARTASSIAFVASW